MGIYCVPGTMLSCIYIAISFHHHSVSKYSYYLQWRDQGTGSWGVNNWCYVQQQKMWQKQELNSGCWTSEYWNISHNCLQFLCRYLMVKVFTILKCLPILRPVFPQCYSTSVFIRTVNGLIEAIQTKFAFRQTMPKYIRTFRKGLCETTISKITRSAEQLPGKCNGCQWLWE